MFTNHLTPHIMKCLWTFYYSTLKCGEYQPLLAPFCIVLRPARQNPLMRWGEEWRVRIFDISPILQSLGVGNTSTKLQISFRNPCLPDR